MKQQLLNTVGHFTWSYGQYFLIETKIGNFIWKNPSFYGDNTIRRFYGCYDKWCKYLNIPYGQDKGDHAIGDYCGPYIIFVE